MQAFSRSFLISISIFFSLAVGFAAGLLARDSLPTHLLLPVLPRQSLPLLTEAHSILVSNAYDPVPPDTDLEYGMIRGMLQAYGDPYTVFLEPSHSQLESHTLEGRYGGIGATLQPDPEGYILLFPYPDSPAIKAGIIEGDRLIKVDNLDITPGLLMDLIITAIRGPVNQRVTLTVARPPDFLPLEYVIRREEFSLPSVAWRLAPQEPRLGIIEINLISAKTPEEIESAVKELRERDATHFVLDLRNNGGGLLTSGVDTARLFLNEGVIMEQQYAGKDVESYQVNRNGALHEIPLAVLVNHYTASAAEIVAGALQVNERAPLIGAPTFGKNTIQLIFTLQDGSSMHVTSARWWIPGLKFPMGDYGLEPDVRLAHDEETHTYIDAAISALFGEE
jgi:carboxyl-terminal processing protease